MLWVEIAFECLFAAGVYAAAYGGVRRALEHPHALRLACGLDVRFNYFNREVDVDTKHCLLHTLASICTGAVLSATPLVRTVLYFAHGFVHVTELNRLLFAVFFLRAARHFNLLSRRAAHSWSAARDVFAAAGAAGCFRLPELAAAPLVFQLADEAFELGAALQEVHVACSQLFAGYPGNAEGGALGALILWRAHRRGIAIARCATLAFFLALHAHFCAWPSLTDVAFYYYGCYRVFRAAEEARGP